MNAQSSGTVTLASTDPSAPPLISTIYLSHPYDRRVAIEALRSITRFSETSLYAAMMERRIEGPPADVDDEAFFFSIARELLVRCGILLRHARWGGMGMRRRLRGRILGLGGEGAKGGGFEVRQILPLFYIVPPLETSSRGYETSLFGQILVE